MFKRIKNFPNYKINESGIIVNVKKQKMIKPQLTEQNYLCVYLYNNGKRKKLKLHRLVMQTFKPRKNFNNYEIGHKNDDRLDCRIDNLEYTTRKKNMNKRWKDKVHTKNSTII